MTHPNEITRGLYEALKLAIRQNSHDMLMTGEELRKCEAAASAYEQSLSQPDDLDVRVRQVEGQ